MGSGECSRRLSKSFLGLAIVSFVLSRALADGLMLCRQEMQVVEARDDERTERDKCLH